jgi:hypothetical protein
MENVYLKARDSIRAEVEMEVEDFYIGEYKVAYEMIWELRQENLFLQARINQLEGNATQPPLL